MKYKYEELKQKSVSRRQRCFSPENSAKRRDLEYQESIAFPVIDYANTAKICTSISDLSNNNTNLLYVKSASISKHNFQNIYSYQTEEEIKLKNFEQSREINTRLNIRISDRCKDLIECTKFPACSNIKLKRKLRMLSASPKRNITHFIQGLSCVSKDQVLANHFLLIQRSKMREQVLQNLNLKGKNKDLTRKVFELCINLKNKSAS